MSQAHKDAFERVKLEYEAVVSLMRTAARDKRGTTSRHKDPSTGSPLQDEAVLETAAVTANDAYALLLLAKAEGFMRTYLTGLGIQLPQDPKLAMLIDRCRKEFNLLEPINKIHAKTVREFQDIRNQRNIYAHGHGSRVFPSVGRIVNVLGRFFNDLP